jgi:hypothetical protein
LTQAIFKKDRREKNEDETKVYRRVEKDAAEYLCGWAEDRPHG